MRQIVLIQPPFVQLNSPYPAPYYLKSFLEQRGFEVTVLDHSIGLFERIFSRSGLERIFADAADGSGASPGSRPSGASGKRGRNRIAAEIAERFFSEKELWLASIDRLVAFLRGRDPEWGHFLALANGCVPGGPRLDAYLAQRQGEVLPDEAKLLATWLLDDLADFISFSLDRGFSLIRYAPVHYAPVMKASLNSGFRDFAAVEKSLGANSSAAYIMHTFYRPMLEEEWERLEKGGTCISGGGSAPFLLGLTIPFPGCLSGALVCAESAKKRFGSAVCTVAGGGFVNTELRFLNAPGFFDYFDYVSLDKGYGSLAAILEHAGAGGKSAPPRETGAPLYKTLYRFQGTVVAPPENYVLTENKELEDQAVKITFPDYSAVDFSRYLYPVDDTNPMHRLWSDGHWLKAYLAYGCYWHHCAFCDVTLDYIRSFVPVDPVALFAHLKDQADKTGIRGIHLVDEAAPVSSLLEFALLNREAGLPLSFWGNIRFEKDFTADIAAILAAGGLMGVSAGLEVATERGFRRLGKGIDLESSVRACAAFKEAGILTHAYLIYGYWDEDEQEIIDSAEILRQLFALKLLDSAFWHKFVLTRHSRIYAEKQRGLHPGLVITGDLSGTGDAGKGDTPECFALNDLSFEGEENFDKYTEPLERLLGTWMKGDTEMPVTKAFPFRVKSPSVPPDLVDDLLGTYMGDQIAEREQIPGKKKPLREEAGKNVLFLGSAPRLYLLKERIYLRWYWQLEERKLLTNSREEAENFMVLLGSASRGKGLALTDFFSSLKKIAGKDRAGTIWICLRESGLAVYPAPGYNKEQHNHGSYRRD